MFQANLRIDNHVSEAVSLKVINRIESFQPTLVGNDKALECEAFGLLNGTRVHTQQSNNPCSARRAVFNRGEARRTTINPHNEARLLGEVRRRQHSEVLQLNARTQTSPVVWPPENPRFL